MNNQELQDKLNRHLSFLAQDENNLSLLIEISTLYQNLNDLTSAQTYLDRANHNEEQRRNTPRSISQCSTHRLAARTYSDVHCRGH